MRQLNKETTQMLQELERIALEKNNYSSFDIAQKFGVSTYYRLRNGFIKDIKLKDCIKLADIVGLNEKQFISVFVK